MNNNLLLLLLLLLTACTGRQEHMRERLQYVSACNHADTVFTARWLPTVDSLVSYFSHHGSANDRMMAHYVAGRVHHDMGEAPQALDCYQRAAEQADTTSDDCDYYTLTALYGQMATLFHIQYLPSDEMQALHQSEYYAWKDHDTLAAVRAYELRVRPYFLRNDTDSVLFIEEQARKIYLKLGEKTRAAQAIRVSISLLTDQQQYTEAHHLMEIYEKESELFDSLGNVRRGKELYYYDLGRYLLATGHPDSALICFNRTLRAGNVEAGYKGLLMFYEQKHIADSIAKYAQLFADANDASYLDSEQEAIHLASASYNYNRQRNLAERHRADAERLKKQILAMTAFVVILILAITIFFLRRNLRAESKVNFMAHKFAAQLFELAKNKAEMKYIDQHYMKLLSEKEAEECRLKSELQEYEKANRQLSMDYDLSRKDMETVRQEIDLIKAEYASTIESKSELIRDLQAEVNRQSVTIKQNTNEQERLSFYESEEFKIFDRLRHYVKGYTPPSEEDWKNLISLFRRHFTRYYLFLIQHETLSESQLRLCFLLRLHFSEGEIMLLMGMSHKQAVTKIKSQVNAKLFDSMGASSLREHLKPYY